MSAILSKVGRLVEEGDERVSIGGSLGRLDIPVVDLRLSSTAKAATWINRIEEVKGESVVIYTDGSMSETGRVGGGWCSEGGTVKGCVGLGRMATVWDGEIAGLCKAVESSPGHWKVLVLTDSQAPISATVKAGRRGSHRTADLGKLLRQIKLKQEELGADAVKVGWVKAHIGIPGNERADALAKEGS